jgi:carboxylesterase type B
MLRSESSSSVFASDSRRFDVTRRFCASVYVPFRVALACAGRKAQSTHGAEIPFVFDNLDKAASLGARAKASSTRATMIVNDECRVENDPAKAERVALGSLQES